MSESQVNASVPLKPSDSLIPKIENYLREKSGLSSLVAHQIRGRMLGRYSEEFSQLFEAFISGQTRGKSKSNGAFFQEFIQKQYPGSKLAEQLFLKEVKNDITPLIVALTSRLEKLVLPQFESEQIWFWCAEDILVHWGEIITDTHLSLLPESHPDFLKLQSQKQLFFQGLQSIDSLNLEQSLSALCHSYAQEIAIFLSDKLGLNHLSYEELERLVALKDFQVDSSTPVTESKLTDSNLPIPTSAALVSSIKAQIRKDLWQSDSQGIAYFKHQAPTNSQNYIEHYITTHGDIQILPWSQAEQIIDKFGFDTVKLHLIFAAHTMNQIRPWESKFTLKGTDIVKYLGGDKRTDLPLYKKLNKIAQTAFVLDCLLVKSVWVESINKKGEINASNPTGRMWNLVVDPQGKSNEEGKVEKPKEVYITVQPGLIFHSFLNKAGWRMKEALYQFGYLAQNILQIDPYHDELALRLAIHLTTDSRVHPTGIYRVETLLKSVLPHTVVNEARSNSNKASKLKERWDKALRLLQNLKWQIEFEEQSYPEWLQPFSQAPKPTDWRKIKIIERLLAAKITIKPPEPIPELIKAKIPPQTKTQKSNSKAATTRLSGDQIRNARNAKGWSQRKLAGLLDVTQTLIGFWEKGKRTPSPQTEAQLRELLQIDD